MRWLTCTPVDFSGSEVFFTRDTGLLSRGFLTLGCESQAVVAGVRRPDDSDELIRADIKDLQAADWWRRQGVTGVVLYAWGLPRFETVARAIRESGAFLVLNQDSSGAVSPLAGWLDWCRDLWARHGGFGKLPSFATRVIYAHTFALWRLEAGRCRHFKHGNVIAAVSPIATERYQKLCRIYGGAELASRVAFIPHPVSSEFGFPEGVEKQDLVVSVGRWADGVQKRPDLLANSIVVAANQRRNTRFLIIGDAGNFLHEWHACLPYSIKARVELTGKLSSSDVARFMRQARVFLSSSSYEGAQVAAMEALCSGCTFVGYKGSSLACNYWFAEDNQGALASRQDSLGETILGELSAWDRGDRNPVVQSAKWCGRVHAPMVANRILDLWSNQQPPSAT